MRQVESQWRAPHFQISTHENVWFSGTTVKNASTSTCVTTAFSLEKPPRGIKFRTPWKNTAHPPEHQTKSRYHIVVHVFSMVLASSWTKFNVDFSLSDIRSISEKFFPSEEIFWQETAEAFLPAHPVGSWGSRLQPSKPTLIQTDAWGRWRGKKSSCSRG